MKHNIGVDIGGTKIKGGIVKGKRVVSKHEIVAGSDMVERVKTLISKLIGKKKISKIGIACAGLVNPKKGLIYYSPNIAELNNLNLAKIIKKEFKVKTFVINDVNAFCLGEWMFGAGKKAKNLVVLTLGTGIGGAAIVNGKLLWGGNYMAGEFGHMVIDKNGPKCACGRRGCFEIMAAQDAIVRLGKRKGLKKLDPKSIAELAKKGNRRAIAVYDRIGYRLAIGIGNLINIFDPEVVIIGGGIARAGNVLFDPIRLYIKAQVMGDKYRAVKVLKTKLGWKASIIGAAYFEKKLLAPS